MKSPSAYEILEALSFGPLTATALGSLWGLRYDEIITKLQAMAWAGTVSFKDGCWVAGGTPRSAR